MHLIKNTWNRSWIMADTSAVAIRRFNRNIELNCVTRVCDRKGNFFCVWYFDIDRREAICYSWGVVIIFQSENIIGLQGRAPVAPPLCATRRSAEVGGGGLGGL